MPIKTDFLLTTASMFTEYRYELCFNNNTFLLLNCFLCIPLNLENVAGEIHV